ncbi:MAG: shikimate dehydrogenase [Pigmentiphaga sp.]
MTVPPDRYAVIGNPIAHSRSPQIHAAFARQTGEAVRYERLLAPLDGFATGVRDFFDQGGRGLNVTVPFKQEAWDLARDHLSPRARAAGAVNTLWQQKGHLAGCNTDGVGLLRDLQRLGAPVAGAHILLVGAGGAARGVIEPLLGGGCAGLRVVNRTASRAVELIHDLAELDDQGRLDAGGLDAARRGGGWDLVINATASSLHGDAPELPWDGLWRQDGWAYDMMYGSQPTPFLRVAQARGAAMADGLGMLVEQAAESFYLWRGVIPATAPVLAALRQVLLTGGGADAPLDG